MENLESLLRDEFQEGPAFDDIKVADLMTGVRRRRNRAVPVPAMVGIVMVLLVAGGVVVLTNRPHSGGSGPDSLFGGAQGTAVNAFGIPVDGRFVDAQHGFIELERCVANPTPSPHGDPETCSDVLEVTTDGGVTYHEYPLPATVRHTQHDLYVFDAQHLVLAQSLGGNFSSAAPFPSHVPGMIEPNRWVSSDGGQSWRQIGLVTGAPVDQIPAGAQFLLDGWGGKPPGVLTADGAAHVLTPTDTFGANIGDEWRGEPVGEIGGAYFVYDSGPDGSDPLLGMRVSRDDGRDWTPVEGPTGVNSFRVLGWDGQRFYASAYFVYNSGGDAATSTTTVSQSYFSSIDGVTWTATPAVPNDGDGNYAYEAATLPAPIGGLLAAEGKHLYHVTASAATTSIPNTVTTMNLRDVGPYVAALRVTDDNQVTLGLTADGTHWQDGTVIAATK